MMTYKGYSANIEVDLDAEILFGRVLDINDVVTFKAQTIEEARQEFQTSIDDYLEFCQELGQKINHFLVSYHFVPLLNIIAKSLLRQRRLAKVSIPGWMRC
jgi:predicted RNase H-like HicB family nuclease